MMKNALILLILSLFLTTGCATHTQVATKIAGLDTADIYHDLLGPTTSSTLAKTATVSAPIPRSNDATRRVAVGKAWGKGFDGNEYQTITVSMITDIVRVGIDLAKRGSTSSPPTQNNITVSGIDVANIQNQKSTSRLVIMPSIALRLIEASLTPFDIEWLNLRLGVYSGLGYDFHFDLTDTEFKLGETKISVPTDLKSKDGVTSHSTVELDISFVHLFVDLVLFTDPRLNYGIGVTW